MACASKASATSGSRQQRLSHCHARQPRWVAFWLCQPRLTLPSLRSVPLLPRARRVLTAIHHRLLHLLLTSSHRSRGQALPQMASSSSAGWCRAASRMRRCASSTRRSLARVGAWRDRRRPVSFGSLANQPMIQDLLTSSPLLNVAEQLLGRLTDPMPSADRLRCAFLCQAAQASCVGQSRMTSGTSTA